jgi:hypothetical protein
LFSFNRFLLRSGKDLSVPVKLHKAVTFDPEETEDAILGAEPDLARKKSRRMNMPELFDRFDALRFQIFRCAPKVPGPFDPTMQNRSAERNM